MSESTNPGVTGRLMLLSWVHPNIGRIEEPVCPDHLNQVMGALQTLGVGCTATEQHHHFTCLRCQASPGNIPRTLLRQWFGKARGLRDDR